MKLRKEFDSIGSINVLMTTGGHLHKDLTNFSILEKF